MMKFISIVLLVFGFCSLSMAAEGLFDGRGPTFGQLQSEIELTYGIQVEPAGGRHFLSGDDFRFFLQEFLLKAEQLELEAVAYDRESLAPVVLRVYRSSWGSLLSRRFQSKIGLDDGDEGGVRVFHDSAEAAVLFIQQNAFDQ